MERIRYKVKFAQLDDDERERVLDAHDRLQAQVAAGWRDLPYGPPVRLREHAWNVRCFILGRETWRNRLTVTAPTRTVGSTERGGT